MSILESVMQHRAEQLTARRQTAIGADLIPRAAQDHPRFTGEGLAARARDDAVLRVALSRLPMQSDALPADMRTTAERIAGELSAAAMEEIGRWATDCQYAYSEIRNISPAVESAMFHAWRLAVNARRTERDAP